MHDCCRSRKGFGPEERHGINDTTTIRVRLFPNKFPYGRPPELSCALVTETTEANALFSAAPREGCAKRHRCQSEKLACLALVYLTRGPTAERTFRAAPAYGGEESEDAHGEG